MYGRTQFRETTPLKPTHDNSEGVSLFLGLPTLFNGYRAQVGLTPSASWSLGFRNDQSAGLEGKKVKSASSCCLGISLEYDNQENR